MIPNFNSASEIIYSQLKGAVARLVFKLKRNENWNTTKPNVIVQKKKIANGQFDDES